MNSTGSPSALRPGLGEIKFSCDGIPVLYQLSHGSLRHMKDGCLSFIFIPNMADFAENFDFFAKNKDIKAFARQLISSPSMELILRFLKEESRTKK